MGSLRREVFNVARQAIEYTREHANKPNFVRRAESVLMVADAVEIGETIGQKQGWGVVELDGGHWAVQADDDMTISKITS